MTVRNHTLDVIRAIAILAVLSTHLTNQFAGGTVLAKGLSVGGRGVDLFFVLSGWLLGSQLIREAKHTGTIDVCRFWLRRWLRTLPAYYAVLFATFAQFVIQGQENRIDWRYLFFFQNYYETCPFLGVTWSLCVEEHFYLIIAPALLLAYRSRWAVGVLMAVIAILIVLHIGGYYIHRPDYHITETHILFEQCGMGVLLVLISLQRPKLWAWICRWALVPFFISLVAITLAVLNRVSWNWILPDWGTGGWALIFASWIVLANSSEFWRTRVRSRILAWIALRAYSLYLVHIEAIVMAKKLPVSSEGQFLASILLAFLFAEILFRFVERPFQSLRDRWKSSRQPSSSD